MNLKLLCSVVEVVDDPQRPRALNVLFLALVPAPYICYSATFKLVFCTKGAIVLEIPPAKDYAVICVLVS